jgi:hypothetical protein
MSKYILLILPVLFIACNNGGQATEEDSQKVENSQPATPAPEGERNRRGYPIGTIEQAEQLLAGVNAKRRELNRRVTDLIGDQTKGQEIISINKRLEALRPRLSAFDTITRKIIDGERVDFLSEQDLGKVQYREQSLLDALIDSLSYINSLYDQVLSDSDHLIMEKQE